MIIWEKYDLIFIAGLSRSVQFELIAISKHGLELWIRSLVYNGYNYIDTSRDETMYNDSVPVS